jgi:hypothetical protein
MISPPWLHGGEAALVHRKRTREIAAEQPDPVRASARELSWVSVFQQVDQILAASVERLQTDEHPANLSASFAAVFAAAPCPLQRESLALERQGASGLQQGGESGRSPVAQPDLACPAVSGCDRQNARLMVAPRWHSGVQEPAGTSSSASTCRGRFVPSFISMGGTEHCSIHLSKAILVRPELRKVAGNWPPDWPPGSGIGGVAY